MAMNGWKNILIKIKCVFCLVFLKVPSFLASLAYITCFYFGPDKLGLINLLQKICNLRRNANCTCGNVLVSLSPC